LLIFPKFAIDFYFIRKRKNLLINILRLLRDSFRNISILSFLSIHPVTYWFDPKTSRYRRLLQREHRQQLGGPFGYRFKSYPFHGRCQIGRRNEQPETP